MSGRNASRIASSSQIGTDSNSSHDTESQDQIEDKGYRYGGLGGIGGEGGYDIFGGTKDQDHSLNRDMVKQVSALIVERETAVIKAKQRAEEARIRLIMGEKFKPKEDKGTFVGNPPPIAGIEFLYTTY